MQTKTFRKRLDFARGRPRGPSERLCPHSGRILSSPCSPPLPSPPPPHSRAIIYDGPKRTKRHLFSGWTSADYCKNPTAPGAQSSSSCVAFHQTHFKCTRSQEQVYIRPDTFTPTPHDYYYYYCYYYCTGYP